jgi:protein-disulfide isomerase-like protein with CxxC motif
MSWNDFYRRRDVLDAVLHQARQDPEGELPFARIAGAQELFGTKQDLLLALQHRWTQLLSGHLRAAAACPDDAYAEAGRLDDDLVDAVSRAWQEAVRNHETLRAVLDAHAAGYPALLAMHQAEQRMLAVTAGLAEPRENVAEITKVGHAFDALLRNRPTRPPQRRSPVRQLLGMLAPSA